MFHLEAIFSLQCSPEPEVWLITLGNTLQGKTLLFLKKKWAPLLGNPVPTTEDNQVDLLSGQERKFLS